MANWIAPAVLLVALLLALPPRIWPTFFTYGVSMTAIKRLLLRLALGNRTYAYMVRTLQADQRLRTARLVDIVVRKDAREERIEADWLKTLARLVHGVSAPSEYKPSRVTRMVRWMRSAGRKATVGALPCEAPCEEAEAAAGVRAVQ